MTERGIIVDLFAGGGGASTAIFQATGRHPDVAVNHNPVAIAVHQANHPGTRHFHCSVLEVDPVEATGGRPVDLLWASPDCTHFSKARGGKPVEKRIRSLADVVVTWVRELGPVNRPKVIALENVEEFKDWGPVLENGQPCPERKGLDFRRWVKDLRDEGYAVEWRELVAADYGAPTTRKRLFLIARRDGLPIRWPRPTHASRARIAKGDPDAVGLAPWRAAAEIINWNLPIPSIFDRKRPLKPKTLARIAKGIQRYVIEAPQPFIVPVTHTQGGHGPSEQVPTMTRAKGGEFAVAAPSLMPVTHRDAADRHRPLPEPVPTMTGAHRGELALTSAFLAPRYGERAGQEPRALDIEGAYPVVVPTGNGGDLAAVHMTQFNGRSVGGEPVRPLPTAVSRDRHGTVAAYLGRQFGSTVSGRPMQEPHPTVMTQGERGGSKSQVVAANLIRQQGQSVGSDAASPAGVVMPTGQGKAGVVAAAMIQHNGWSVGREASAPAAALTDRSTQNQLLTAHLGSIAYGDGWDRPGLRAWPAGEPTGVVTGSSDKTVVAAAIDKYYATGVAQAAAEALGTATAKARFGLNAAFLEQANTGVVGHSAREPLSTIVGGGGMDVGWGTTQRLIGVGMIPADDVAGASTRAKVVAFLWEQFGQPTEAEWADPLATAGGRLKFGLVILDGAVWQIVDIGMRMLVPAELFAAQGFPPSYVIDIVIGSKPITKTAQTSLAGNSVSPPPATALLRATLPEEWLWQEAA